jgi:hypothetical protein
MSYQYLYCAACGTRRAGHGYQCSVCGGLLRHDVQQIHQPTPFTLQTAVRGQKPVTADQPARQPVGAR